MGLTKSKITRWCSKDVRPNLNGQMLEVRSVPGRWCTGAGTICVVGTKVWVGVGRVGQIEGRMDRQEKLITEHISRA